MARTRNPEDLWMQITIRVHPNTKEVDEWGNPQKNHYHYHILKSWEYPKWIIMKHAKFFWWVMCMYQVRFKYYGINKTYCGYYPDTKERMGSKRLNAISAAKAQVTKVENAIAYFIEEQSKSLFSDYENEPVYKNLLCKLEEKKFKLEQAVMQQIEETI